MWLEIGVKNHFYLYRDEEGLIGEKSQESYNELIGEIPGHGVSGCEPTSVSLSLSSEVN